VKISSGNRNFQRKELTLVEQLSQEVPRAFLSQEAIKFRKNYQANQDELLTRLVKEFDKTLFNGRLAGSVRVVWNNRLRSTYGQTYFNTEGGKRTALIEISPRKNDAPWHLCETVIHEQQHGSHMDTMVNMVPNGYFSLKKQ
jgi:SprT-like family